MKSIIFSLITFNILTAITTHAITLNCKTPHDGAKHRMYRADPYEKQKKGYFNIEPVDSHVFWDQFEVMCEVKKKKTKGQSKQYAVMNMLGAGPGLNINVFMGYRLYCPNVSNIAMIANKTLLGTGLNASALLSARIGFYSTIDTPIRARCILIGLGGALIGGGASVNAINITPVNPKNVVID